MSVHKASRMIYMRLFTLMTVALLATAASLAALQPSLLSYEARMKTFKAQIPAVVASAQQSAEITLRNPDALLSIPYRYQPAFASELRDRAGGLARADQYSASSDSDTPATPHDTVLLTVRSWETMTDDDIQYIKECKEKGWTVVLIASAAGKPANLGEDFFIDNGAPSGSADYGRINAIANVTLGWMWCCEYAAAMSRKEKFPAVLYSVAMPGAGEYDAMLQEPKGRLTVVDSPKAIPAGKSSQIYLKRVGKLLRDLKSRRIQGQVRKATEIIAARMAAGKSVGISGIGHMIVSEFYLDMRSPWKVVGASADEGTYKGILEPGELLVWFGYAGINSQYADYQQCIQSAGLDLITCNAPSKEFPTTIPVLAHIEQPWKLPDAEVPIPVFPYAMAPVSGIYSTLTMRMLDEAVAVLIGK